MMKNLLAAIALSAVAILASSAHANHDAAGGANTLSEGEVRRVDAEARKLTLRHGPLENLGMPAMTMVFQVKDSAMLDGVNVGDKVKFFADKIGGAYTVTHLEPVR